MASIGVTRERSKSGARVSQKSVPTSARNHRTWTDIGATKHTHFCEDADAEWPEPVGSTQAELRQAPKSEGEPQPAKVSQGGRTTSGGRGGGRGGRRARRHMCTHERLRGVRLIRLPCARATATRCAAVSRRPSRRSGLTVRARGRSINLPAPKRLCQLFRASNLLTSRVPGCCGAPCNELVLVVLFRGALSAKKRAHACTLSDRR